MTLTSFKTACGIATAAGLALGGCASHENPAQPKQSRSLTLTPDSHATASGTPASGPYQVGLTGGDNLAFSDGQARSADASHPEVPAEGQQKEAVHSGSVPFDFYGEIMAAGAGPGPTNESWTGQENLSQSSFAIEGSDFDPCVTPRGDRIIFASTQHTPTANLYIKGVESRTVTQLTNDAADNVMPKVSPDGSRIAFASNRAGNWDVFVMPITGGRALQVTSEASAELHPTWSPDGRSIAFCRLGMVSGRWEIWVTDVQSSGTSQFLTYGLFPQWCPVSGTGEGGTDRILFQRSRERGDRSFGVWTIDYKDGQASGATEIVASAVAACINPSWSPDGEWITFSTVPSAAAWASSADGRPASANLWLINGHGGGLVCLTNGAAVNLMPTWGSGNRLYFVSDRGGVENIWHMNASDAIIAASGRVGDGTAIGHGGEPGRGHEVGPDVGHAEGGHEVGHEVGQVNEHENAQAGVEEDAHR